MRIKFQLTETSVSFDWRTVYKNYEIFIWKYKDDPFIESLTGENPAELKYCINIRRIGDFNMMFSTNRIRSFLKARRMVECYIEGR